MPTRVRRLGLLVPLVFLITVVVFLLAHLVPGGPVAALLGEHATNTATVNAIKARYHLNESLLSQYGAWAGPGPAWEPRDLHLYLPTRC